MRIEVSIVSGTYNRLPHMQRMVSSARCSVDPLSYEIILVDGGSTDGTIEWCKEQPDITIIEQGQLLGAVKAFNEGARAARGRYVVLANDDIEFVDSSILRSWAFMEDFKTVGVGCFYQDRNRQVWHVEHMPAVAPGGKIISVPYGQVCIVPTWLGSRVGWWGDYLHTYGGDNELSSNILELGFEVCPVERAYIHDFSQDLNDELRRINNDDPQRLAAQGRTHPDSAKWYAKWSRSRKVGPRVRFTPVIANELPESRIRFLYAPIYEPGNRLQKQTKFGLKKALNRVGVVQECDYMTEGISGLMEKACAICPDIFVLQIQDSSVFSVSVLEALKRDHPSAQFVSWNGDYHPNNLYDPEYIRVMGEMDAAGFAVASIKEAYEAQGVNWFYWQIGYEESNARPDQTTERHDVIFLGNGYTRQRKDLARFLLSLRDTGINVGLYGSWPEGWSLGSNLYNFGEGQKLYAAAKVAISDQQWPEATGYVSNRLFQAMAAGGCVVLQQYFDGMEDYLELEIGTHLIAWDSHERLKEEIDWVLEHPEISAQIAAKGQEFMLKSHSFDVRVKELMDVLDK